MKHARLGGLFSVFACKRLRPAQYFDCFKIIGYSMNNRSNREL